VLQKSALIGAKNIGRVRRANELHGLGYRFAMLLENRPDSICIFLGRNEPGTSRWRATCHRGAPSWDRTRDANEGAPRLRMIGHMT
jgi:hypothetical protein